MGGISCNPYYLNYWKLTWWYLHVCNCGEWLDWSPLLIVKSILGNRALLFRHRQDQCKNLFHCVWKSKINPVGKVEKIYLFLSQYWAKATISWSTGRRQLSSKTSNPLWWWQSWLHNISVFEIKFLARFLNQFLHL